MQGHTKETPDRELPVRERAQHREQPGQVWAGDGADKGWGWPDKGRLPPGGYLDGDLRQAAGLEAPDQPLHAVDGLGDLSGGRRRQLHLGVVPERGQARLGVRHGSWGEAGAARAASGSAPGPPPSSPPVPPNPSRSPPSPPAPSRSHR